MIAVIGLGKAGLPLASVIADSGMKVIGVDIDEERCRMINDGINPIPEERGLDELIEKHGGKNLIATTRYEDARDCDTYIVIVPVFLDENRNADFRILESAVRSIGRMLDAGDLVVIETTLPPKTTETLVKSWLEEESGMREFYLAYSPERIMTGYSISRLKEFPKVVGGVDKESGWRAYELYRKFIPNIHLVSNARTAEFIKVIEGCYRDVNIALANELFKLSESLGIDFDEARRFANHEFCHIHEHSTGVGGHCIPVYPWFLIRMAERVGRFDDVRLLRTAREVNDGMIDLWAKKILLACLRTNKKVNEVRICIKGITFRKGVKEIYHSRNLALARTLKEKGLNVYVYDELFTPEEIKSLGFEFIYPNDADVVFDPFELRVDIKC